MSPFQENKKKNKRKRKKVLLISGACFFLNSHLLYANVPEIFVTALQRKISGPTC
jgi:hypothetical protein